jgi:hypothetical protein
MGFRSCAKQQVVLWKLWHRSWLANGCDELSETLADIDWLLLTPSFCCTLTFQQALHGEQYIMEPIMTPSIGHTVFRKTSLPSAVMVKLGTPEADAVDPFSQWLVRSAALTLVSSRDSLKKTR